MKAPRLRRPQRPPHGESVVALIDVSFFLLVFFMLVGRLDATAPFAVLPPLGQTGTDLPGGGITVSVGQDGALALDGAPLGPEGLAALAPRLSRAPETLVRLNADHLTPLREILPLVSELEAMGAQNVALIVTPDAGAGR